MLSKGNILRGLAVIAAAVTVAAAQTQITTAAQLANLALGGHFVLANDIDLSGMAWTPIGNGGMIPFDGVFDGNGKTISGLSINLPTRDYIGLFGNVANGGVVKNLKVVGANVTGSRMVGGIVGQLWEGKIDNCSFSGTVSGTSSMVGGVVGYVSGGSVTNSNSSGMVNGGAGSGGVVGWIMTGGSVTGCYSASTVSNTVNSIGNVGGVVGVAQDSSSVTGCYFTGAVSGSGQVGGVVGVGDATNSYATGTVSGSGGLVGGVVGQGNATNCYSTGAITGGGGVVGSGTATNCAALNPSVKGGGRVVGSSGGLTPSSGNVAFNDMEGTFYNNALNGTDINIPEIHADGTIKGLFTNAAVWTTTPGFLPGLNGQVVAMPAHLEMENANFKLVYSAGPGGRLIGSLAQVVSPGSDGAAVVAVADDGYVFVSWSDGVTTAERTDKKVAGNITAAARFVSADSKYTLTYTAGAGGRVMGSLTQVVALWSDGAAVVAIANDGYVFVSWSDGVTTAERTDLNVTAGITVTANFAIAQYTLRYSLGPGGKDFIGGSAEQTVSHGSNGAEVYAVANTGYTFARWSDGSTANPRTDKNVQGDTAVTAYFADSEGNVSVLSNDRIVTLFGNSAESAVVAPAGVLSAEFTAGPNPATKSGGVINFYYGASPVSSGALAIYDVSGNVVRKIKIAGKNDCRRGGNLPPAVSASGQLRRPVGSWDLKDAKDRVVNEGVYLVKGTIVVNGRREGFAGFGCQIIQTLIL